MPEGPELRYLSELLKKEIQNKTLTKITALSKRRVYIPKSSRVLEIGTKGKLLWIRTRDYYIHMHLYLTGWIYLEEPEYTKYILEFGNTKIYIDSMRKFTRLKVLKQAAHKRVLDKLGLDILTKEFALDPFTTLIKSRNMAITKFILDQDKICGAGNYIKSEVLYLSRIHPKKKTSQLTDKQIVKLFASIQYVAFSKLVTWLKLSKMKTPADIKKIKPKKLSVPYRFRVYEREKDPQGNRVTTEDIGGRATYYVKKVL